MGKAVDPIAKRLAARAEPRAGGSVMKVIAVYGERPAVLDEIRKARRDRKLSFDEIAELISDDDVTFSSDAVQRWLKKQGIT